MPASEIASPTRVSHYRVVRLLGRGGMGNVYLARDTRLGRLVALKFLSSHLLGATDVRAQFAIEARTTASLSHPNVVTLFDVGEHEGCPWVALEYIEGITLAERLRRDWPSVPEALRIGLAIARGIEAAHAAGIVHRDLKPANVLLAKDGRPRVVDFGVARFSGSQPDVPKTPVEPGAPSRFLGTPSYMAPEQWAGKDGPATDVWALGLLLHLLLTREQPLDDLDTVRILVTMSQPEPVAVSPELSLAAPSIAPLVLRCLAKNPADRPTASEVVASLEGHDRTARATDNPFRGLAPFSEKHAHLFFGREREVAAFVERLRDAPCLIVVGPSGAGKSSFLLAGVLPRVREAARHRVITLRPGAHPFRSLAVALAAQRASGGDVSTDRDTVVERPGTPRPTDATWRAASPADLEAQLRAHPELLAVLLGDLAAETDARVLVFVDQLEELVTVTQDDDERRAFLQALGSAGAERDEPVRVVMTVRDDFLGRLPWGQASAASLGGLVVLGPPEPDALRDIVRRPLENARHSFDDPGLLEEMVASVRGELACLPLLQFAMSLLWSRRDPTRRLLLREVYDAMGGVGGALASHAEELLAALAPAQIDLCKTLLLRLVTEQGTRRAVPRHRLVEGLPRGADELVQRLVDARLLSLQGSVDGTVELAHESLARVWRRLARWIEESHEDLALATDLSMAADRWERHGRRADELWQGDALRDAARLVARGTTALPSSVKALVAASQLRARRNARLRRVLVGGLLAAAVLATVASTMAAWALRARQRDAAQAASRAEEARARLLEERALASHASGDHHDARAQLRGALEMRDSLPLRNLARQLTREPALLRLPDDGVTYDALLLPDRRTLVTGGQSGLVQLVDVVTREHVVLRGHMDQVLGVASLPDGRIASTSWNGELRVWDPRTGTSEVRRKRAALFGLAVHGSTIAASSDGMVDLVPASGEPRGFAVPSGRTFGLAFDALGRELLVGGDDGRVHRIDPSDGRILRSGAAGSAVLRLVVDRERKRLLVTRRSGALSVLDTGTLEPIREIAAHEGDARGLVLAPDGRVWTGGLDQRIVAWDVDSWMEAASLPTRLAMITKLDLAPDGRTLVASGKGGAELWDIDRIPRSRRLAPHEDAVVDLAFSADGTRIVSTSYRSILSRESATARITSRLPRTGKRGRDAAYDDKNGRVLVTDERGGLALWELASGRLLGTAGSRIVMPVSVAYAPEGDLAAVGTGEGSVLLYRVSDRSLVRELHGHAAEVRGISITRDGATAYSTSTDGTVRAWNTKTGVGTVLHARTGRNIGVSLWEDGQLLAVTGQDGVALVIDLRTKRVLELGTFPGRLQRPAISPDGRTLALPSSDSNVYLLDIASRTRRVVSGHRSEVNVAAFSPDGRWLATGGDDHTVRLFDAATGAPRWQAPEDERDVAAGEKLDPAEPAVVFARRLAEPPVLVVGYASGNVELRAAGTRPRSLRETPSSPLVAVTPGPAGTLALGFEDGTFGAWEPSQGIALERTLLHGRIVGVANDGGVMRARSELGDTEAIDLRELARDYCAVMDDLRRAVPFVWQDGLVKPAPEAAPCRRP